MSCLMHTELSTLLTTEIHDANDSQPGRGNNDRSSFKVQPLFLSQRTGADLNLSVEDLRQLEQQSGNQAVFTAFTTVSKMN